MKKFLCFVFAGLIATSAFSQGTVLSKWRSKTIVADGQPSEWNKPLRLYSSETGLFFDIVNDSSRLFLVFQVKDEKKQVKINRAGMKIHLKAKGKMPCDATLNFPVVNGKRDHVTDEENTPESGQGWNRHSMRNRFIMQNTSLQAQGLATQNGIIALKDSGSIRAAIDWDSSNVMTYELSIPLKELFGSAFVLKQATKAITMKVEINAFAKPESADSPMTDDHMGSTGSGMGGRGSTNGGMGGGMGGGGMGGGGMHHGGGGHGGAGSPERAAMFEANRMKQPFLLAIH